MTPEQRRLQIVGHVRTGGRATVEQLADDLGSSRETIRRDLGLLDSQGLLRKIHGGAVMPEPGVFAAGREDPFHARLGRNVAAKRAMARAARALFHPGDSVLIDTGTTTLILAEELAQCRGLTVITNSAAIAALAAKGEDGSVFLLGGEFRRGGQECVGELVLEQIRQFRTTHAILTVGAVGPEGFMNYDLQETQVARAMARQAAQVTIMADATKMDHLATFQVGPLAMARRLVSDAVPPALASSLRNAGVELVTTD